MAKLNRVLVQLGRRSTALRRVNYGGFRNLVEQMITRAYPGAHVTVLFNDALADDCVDIGDEQGTDVAAVRELVAVAWRRAERVSHPDMSPGSRED